MKNKNMKTRGTSMSKKSRKTKQVHHPTESQICMLLKEEKNHLQKIISEAEKRNTHAPEGSVLAKKHKNSVQFYYRSESGDKVGKYMRVSERAKAIALYIDEWQNAEYEHKPFFCGFLTGKNCSGNIWE